MKKKADENAGKFEKNREITRNEDQTSSRERQRCISEKEKKSTKRLETEEIPILIREKRNFVNCEKENKKETKLRKSDH
jgi:hypothetical protein